jgi:hypothetical protein
MANLNTLAPDFTKEPPASREDIENYELQLARHFPASYCEFLLEANGGEGSIGESGYVMLWPLHALEENLKGYKFDRYVPDFLPIGSDGGGEALVIDYRTNPHRLGYVPFSDLQYESFVPISANFWDALRIIGEGRVFDYAHAVTPLD